MNWALAVLLIAALVAANLPFLTERFLLVWRPRSGTKSLALRLLEIVLLYFVVGGLALMLEREVGQTHPQRWEFYAVTASLFLVFAYPGFVYRYLWRRRGA